MIYPSVPNPSAYKVRRLDHYDMSNATSLMRLWLVRHVSYPRDNTTSAKKLTNDIHLRK